MAETLVEEKICGACGADVRPQATFCYNCGSAVAPDIPLDDNNRQTKSNSWFNDDFAKSDERESALPKKGFSTETIPVEKNKEKISTNSSGEKLSKRDEQEKLDLSTMDSAAKIRKRGKPIQKRRVEIVWEEHENAPNGWFIFFALFFTILALAIWLISTRLE